VRRWIMSVRSFEIMQYHEYDDVVTGVMKARRTAEKATLKASSLSDKERMVKLANKLSEAQKILRVVYSEFGGACAILGEKSVVVEEK
jgi:hypothetical protein